VSNYFWSSSVLPYDSGEAYVFDGRSGFIYYGFSRYDDVDIAVRCVARR
jgi:hypothetical protein